jgi:branched-chain amino acid transport system substrate-binding protein
VTTQLTRRRFLASATATAVAGTAGLSAGCSNALKGSTGSGSAAGATIKIGYVSPETGSVSVFTQSNHYVLQRVRAALSKGLTIGGKKHAVEIITKDSQSSSARAASAAAELIQQNQVNFLIATATPDTVNPVSDQAESSGVPCLSTICPWEQWFYPRGGSATKSFTYTYMYFLGSQEEASIFASVWKKAGSDHVVGGLWPNDVDGQEFRKYVTQEVDGLGWRMVPSGAYADGTQDFTSIITGFKSQDVQLLHAVPIPPDWVTFWRQSAQNRFRPKLACVSKALLFPSAADSLGSLALNLVSPVWWAPTMPYRSSLDGTTASAFADGYQNATGQAWTQPMGFNYAAFEIAVAALKASGDPGDPRGVAHALSGLKGEAITGKYDFTRGPVKNVATIPDLLGQWRPNTGGSGYKLVIIDNSMNPDVAVQGSLEAL